MLKTTIFKSVSLSILISILSACGGGGGSGNPETPNNPSCTAPMGGALIGQIVFASNCAGYRELFAINTDGSGMVRLTNTPVSEHSPSMSADGSKIVFVVGSGRNQELYIMDADGSGKTQLTFKTEVVAWNPTISANGKRIAFVGYRVVPSTEPEFHDAWTMDVTTGNKINLTNDGALEIFAALSPDGSTVAYVSSQRPGTGAEVWITYTSGLRVYYQITNSADDINGKLAFSPDGSQIAFNSFTGNWPFDGQWDIHIMDANGSNRTNLTAQEVDNSKSPQFTLDGRIAFVSPGVNQSGDIFIMDNSGNNRDQLTSTIFNDSL